MKINSFRKISVFVLICLFSSCNTIQDIPPTEAPSKEEQSIDIVEEGEDDVDQHDDEHAPGEEEDEDNDNEASEENASEEDTEEDISSKTVLKHFLIKAGEHYSSRDIVTLSAEALYFQAKFDSSAIYSTPFPQNQADINKLLGMSDCKTFHHTNSARFGWRWHEESLQILAYTYVDGERQSSFIAAVDLNKAYDYALVMEDDHYVFSVGEHQVKMDRGCSGEAQGYMLYPYFGGTNTAPHDVSIWINLDQNLVK